MTTPDVTNTPIANPSDFEFHTRLFRFSFITNTALYVWADHLEDALEEACDWIADHAPGIFTFFTNDEVAEYDGYEVPDHMCVGHTTYPQFGSMPYLAATDWHVQEVDSDAPPAHGFCSPSGLAMPPAHVRAYLRGEL